MALSFGSARGTQITATGGFNRTDFSEQALSRSDLEVYDAGLEVSRRLWSRGSASAGYEFRSGEFGLGPTTEHMATIGVEFSQALSRTRRATVRLNVSPSRIHLPDSALNGIAEAGDQRLHRLSADAEIAFPFRLNWETSASYRRSLEYLSVLNQPVLADGARVELKGLLTRRIDLTVSGGYVTAASAFAPSTAPLETYTGQVAMRYALKRSVAVSAEYLYYYYDLKGRQAFRRGCHPCSSSTVSASASCCFSRRWAGRWKGNVVSVRTHTLRDIVLLIGRKRWLVLIPFALGVAVAPLLARYAPERYRSEALMMVVPQRVPKDYVTPTMTQPIEDRLPTITDQILSRSRLERIIQQMDLYPAERSRQVMEDVVQRMRGDVTTSAASKDVNSFRVSYVSDGAEKARKVTERLASLYIEQNLKDRENQADSTSSVPWHATGGCETATHRAGEKARRVPEESRRTNAVSVAGESTGDSDRQFAAAIPQRIDESRAGAAAADRAADGGQPGCFGVQLPQVRRMRRRSGRRSNSSWRARGWRCVLQRYTPNHPEVTSLERTIADLATKLEGEAPVGAAPAEQKPPASPAEAVAAEADSRPQG